MFFVGSGEISVHVTGYSGRSVTLYNVVPGELCPINLGAVVSVDAALASARAKASIEGATIDATSFRRILTRHQDFRHVIIACLATKFESILRQISEITTRSVGARIERYFEDHIDQVDDNGYLRVTNAQIGTEIGASREVVNRKLRSMQKAGLVELERGRVRLLSPETVPPPKRYRIVK